MESGDAVAGSVVEQVCVFTFSFQPAFHNKSYFMEVKY